MIVSIGVKPDARRRARPDFAKCGVQQIGAEFSALKFANQAEVGKFYFRGSYAMKFTKAGALSVNAQDINMCGWVAEKMVELICRHP